MNTYKWKISTLKLPSMVVGGETLENVLVAVTEVRCIVSDGAHSDSSAYLPLAAPLELGAPVPGSFTSEGDLTDEQVEGWVLSLIDDSALDELKARADAMLALVIAASSPATPVPGRTFGEPPPEEGGEDEPRDGEEAA